MPSSSVGLAQCICWLEGSQLSPPVLPQEADASQQTKPSFSTVTARLLLFVGLHCQLVRKADGSYCGSGASVQPSNSLTATLQVAVPTWMTSSMILVSSTPGTKPAPIPWILCGPGLPPDSTGDSVGSTATSCRCTSHHSTAVDEVVSHHCGH